MEYAMDHHPAKFIFKKDVEFFGIFSYPGNADEYLAREFFARILEGDDIRQRIVLQEFFVESEKVFIAAESETYNACFLFLFFDYSA